jgi:hypothetical protein
MTTAAGQGYRIRNAWRLKGVLPKLAAGTEEAKNAPKRHLK